MSPSFLNFLSFEKNRCLTEQPSKESSFVHIYGLRLRQSHRQKFNIASVVTQTQMQGMGPSTNVYVAVDTNVKL